MDVRAKSFVDSCHSPRIAQNSLRVQIRFLRVEILFFPLYFSFSHSLSLYLSLILFLFPFLFLHLSLSLSLSLSLMYLDIPHICIFGLSNKQKECKVVFEWEGIKLSHRELLLHIIQYA